MAKKESKEPKKEEKKESKRQERKEPKASPKKMVAKQAEKSKKSQVLPKTSLDAMGPEMMDKKPMGKVDINAHLQQLVKALHNSRPATKRRQPEPQAQFPQEPLEGQMPPQGGGPMMPMGGQ